MCEDYGKVFGQDEKNIGRISEWKYDLYELPYDVEMNGIQNKQEDNCPELDFPDLENNDKVNTNNNVNTIKKENKKKETDEISCDPNLERAKEIAKKEMEYEIRRRQFRLRLESVQ